MSENSVPLYQKIYNNILEGIKLGRYGEGDRLPSEKELAEEFNVSRITSKKALELLAEDGLINRMPGKGSFVSSKGAGLEENEPGRGEDKSGFTLLGVVVPDFSVSYGTDLLSGIEDKASENGCYIVTRRSHGRQDLEEEAIDALIEIGVNGIIVMPVHGEHYNPKLLRLILDGFPVVLIDRNLTGIPASFVGSDNTGAAKKATDYLLELGHRNISFISPLAVDTSTIEDRITGFVKSHAEHGVIADESIWLTNLVSTMPGSRNKENILADIEKIKHLLEKNPQITCLFVAEYNIASMAMGAIKSLNRKVPDDISIVCFDGPENYIGDYFYTHIRQKESDMGETAVKFLLEQIDGKAGGDKVFLEADLIIGSSTTGISIQKAD